MIDRIKRCHTKPVFVSQTLSISIGLNCRDYKFKGKVKNLANFMRLIIN